MKRRVGGLWDTPAGVPWQVKGASRILVGLAGFWAFAVVASLAVGVLFLLGGQLGGALIAVFFLLPFVASFPVPIGLVFTARSLRHGGRLGWFFSVVTALLLGALLAGLAARASLWILAGLVLPATLLALLVAAPVREHVRTSTR